MRTRLLRLTTLCALLVAAPEGAAQTLYGVDQGGLLWEFTNSPAGPCPAPTPVRTPCSHLVGPCAGVPVLTPAMPGTILGDVADNGLSDTIWITDGRVITEFAARGPCGVPAQCTPLRSFLAPTIMGGITGMGMDPSGTFTGGIPTLWITDGVLIMGVGVPAAPCGLPTAFVGPCPSPVPSLLTDLTWDPFTSSLWASDTAGFIHHILVPGCTLAGSFPVAPLCGFTAGGMLTGLAYDTATPPTFPLAGPPSFFVTNGTTVAYVAAGGGPAPARFYAPTACTPTNSFLAGLAMPSHGVTYGSQRVLARLTSTGQTTAPGPTFALEVTSAPPGTNAWFLLNYNVPGPGFLCPAQPGVGTKLWVDPSPPALLSNLGPLPGGCVSIPLPIPAAAPPGLQGFMQLVFIPVGGPPAVDATNGLAVTISLP